MHAGETNDDAHARRPSKFANEYLNGDMHVPHAALVAARKLKYALHEALFGPVHAARALLNSETEQTLRWGVN